MWQCIITSVKHYTALGISPHVALSSETRFMLVALFPETIFPIIIFLNNIRHRYYKDTFTDGVNILSVAHSTVNRKLFMILLGAEI